MAMVFPSQAELREWFSYDPETGILTRIRGRSGGGSVGRRCYRQLSFKGKTYLEHRIIWMLVYGTLPDQLDHINGDRVDNRLCNLREATAAQNVWNSEKRREMGPYRGVFKKSRRYYVAITHGGQKTNLGSFPCAFPAALAFRNKERELRGSFIRAIK